MGSGIGLRKGNVVACTPPLGGGRDRLFPDVMPKDPTGGDGRAAPESGRAVFERRIPALAPQRPLAPCPSFAMPPIPGPFGLRGICEVQTRKEIGVT